ncbi:MAG: LysM peptidoglycan-binding domain-containing protein [Limisphaerales bacterium]
MMFSVGLFRTALLLLAGCLLGGCLPSAPGDEEREPYFLAGKAHVSTMDYTGAIQSFEKAVEVNPKSAPAHFELGCLYDSKESDPAAAIYHYERYLKLQPNSANEDWVKTRILACEQQLAQTVSLGPVTERQQRDLEQLAEECKRLRELSENWRAYALRLQALTNQAGATSPVTRAAQSSRSAQPAPADATSPSRPTAKPTATSRTHIVKAGERPSSIARMYGVKLEALMAANPKLDARRMQVGQVLNIPPP